MSARIRIGLIGAGSMGANHARVVHQSDLHELSWISDPKMEYAERLAARTNGAPLVEPELASVDAVIIAAPTEFHRDLAEEVLQAGLPLLLEKPISNNIEETRNVIKRSEELDVPLMCGLLERFNPAVRTALEITSEPLHATATRHSPYVERIRTGVASDLLIHDVDLIIRLFDELPDRIGSVFSFSHPKSDFGSEDVASVVLGTPSGRTAEISASRLSQRKVRTMSIVEVDRLIEIDLLRQDITIHRHIASDVAEVDGLGYRQQSVIEVPIVRFPGEPLALQLEHFTRLIDGKVDADAERESITLPHEVVHGVVHEAWTQGTRSTAVE